MIKSFFTKFLNTISYNLLGSDTLIIVEALKMLTILELNNLIEELSVYFKLDLSLFQQSAKSTDKSTEENVKVIINDEPSFFTLTLLEVPSQKKIPALKLVRTLTNLGLKESKDIVDNVPKLIKEGLTKEECEKWQKDFEELGAKVLIK